jgi:hypothetical protein
MRFTAAGRILTVRELREAIRGVDHKDVVLIGGEHHALAVETAGSEVWIESDGPSVEAVDEMIDFLVDLVDGTSNTKQDIVAEAVDLLQRHNLREYS